MDSVSVVVENELFWRDYLTTQTPLIQFLLLDTLELCDAEAEILECQLLLNLSSGSSNESESVAKNEKMKRNSYSRRDPLQSRWYLDYALDSSQVYTYAAKGSHKDRQFRHRFRMSKTEFENFYDLVIANNWFPEYSIAAIQSDGRRASRSPLKLMIMGALAVLGGTISFDMLPDCTNVSSQTHRSFFDRFCAVGAKTIYPYLVKWPSTNEELREASRPYSMAGMPGAICSTDGVRIRMWACSYSLKHQNVGKEGYPVRTYQVSVGYDMRIFSCTKGHDGNKPDVKISSEDPFFKNFTQNPVYRDFEWEYFTADGDCFLSNGAWVIVDNGYPDWPFLHMPSKCPYTIEEARWSRMIESLRKDVERVFGVLKQRFRILKLGVTIQRFTMIDNIVHTCCALHNFLIEQNGREITAFPMDNNKSLIERLYRPRETQSFNPGAMPKRARVQRPHDAKDLLTEHFDYKIKRGEVFWPKVGKRVTVEDPLPDDSDCE
jgi:hypothetical protein